MSLEIQIKNVNGGCKKVHVNTYETIKNAKEKCGEVGNVWKYNGWELNDSKIIYDYDIEDNDIIISYPNSMGGGGGGIRIMIANGRNKKCILVNGNDTIKQLKEKSGEVGAILMYNGCVLDDSKFISDYGIKDNDTIICTPSSSFYSAGGGFWAKVIDCSIK